MGGAKVKAVDRNLTAPTPELRQPGINMLQGFAQNPQQWLQGMMPQQPSMLQSFGPGGTMSNFLNNLVSNTPGQGVLDAAQPIFQRNMQLGADTLRQAGPRFASNTERLVGEQGNRAMQDFNLFSQQVMQEGINQQLAGAGLAGQVGLGQQSNELGFMGPLLQQMLGTTFGAGGLTQQPTLQQQKPWWQQALGVAGTVGSLAAAIPTGGMSLGALPSFSGMAQGGSTFSPPQFGSSFGQGMRSGQAPPTFGGGWGQFGFGR